MMKYNKVFYVDWTVLLMRLQYFVLVKSQVGTLEKERGTYDVRSI